MEVVTPIKGLRTLLQKQGGLFTGARTFGTNGEEPRMTIRTAQIGDIGALWREVAKAGKTEAGRGGGADLDAESALTPTLAESLERYSTCVFRNEQFVWASANELGPDAVDLDSVPRCSPTELSHPKCPLISPDKTKPIRWVRGLSLLDGRVVYVPVVLVYSHAGFAAPQERFWLPISTGCAAHESYERALLAGIFEVIERDALSIVWLQRMSLPRIDVDCVPVPLAPYWDRYMKASADLEYRFYDATTDLGVPTVYSLQIAPHHKSLTTLVACTTGLTVVEALCKSIRDMTALRLSFRRERAVPSSWDDFTDLLHGATFMARAENAEAFEFLTCTSPRRALSEMQSSQTAEGAITSIVRRLRLSQLNTYVVDLSTDEATRAGMCVVRVLIPGLQPLSLRYRARYLGHSRLYTAPAAMGYLAHPEENLNHWPQPFA